MNARNAEILEPQPEEQIDQTNNSESDEDDDDEMDGTFAVGSDGKFKLNLNLIGRNNEIDDNDDNGVDDDSEFVFRLVKISMFLLLQLDLHILFNFF